MLTTDGEKPSREIFRVSVSAFECVSARVELRWSTSAKYIRVESRMERMERPLNQPFRYGFS